MYNWKVDLISPNSIDGFTSSVDVFVTTNIIINNLIIIPCNSIDIGINSSIIVVIVIKIEFWFYVSMSDAGSI